MINEKQKRNLTADKRLITNAIEGNGGTMPGIKLQHEIALHAIDRAMAAESRLPDPVELPADVEESIMVCLNSGLSRISIITNMDQTSYLIREGSISQQIIQALTIISKHTRQTVGGGQDLLNALANWYEVKDERWVKRDDQ